MNVRRAEGARRWAAAGRPTVPSVLVDGVTTPILHVSQLASALGLPAAPTGDPLALAWDSAFVLEGWLDHLRLLGWDLLVKPTPARGRTLRELTVNVFHPFELLPGAWEGGHFDWYPERDAEREARLQSAEALVRFAERIEAEWTSFLIESGQSLQQRDPLVASPRGEVAYSTLVAVQRSHSAFHYRQLTRFLRAEGVAPPPHAFALESLADLELPAEVF